MKSKSKKNNKPNFVLMMVIIGIASVFLAFFSLMVMGAVISSPAYDDAGNPVDDNGIRLLWFSFIPFSIVLIIFAVLKYRFAIALMALLYYLFPIIFSIRNLDAFDAFVIAFVIVPSLISLVIALSLTWVTFAISKLNKKKK
tara:strand:- start:560 stop:985 length:426 start_codon:yes stop_codon:yes gene_type:complete